MSILRDLINVGISPNEAQILEQTFANEADFLDGLEKIARVLELNEDPGILPPGGEPWLSIHLDMLHSGLDFEQAYLQALCKWDAPIQMAITQAVFQRRQDIQQWMQQSQSQSKKRKTAEYIQTLTNLGYRFRYNICTHNVEVNGDAMSDPMQAEIRGKLRDLGIFEVNIAEDAYFANAWQHRYHPLKDYLTGLKFQGGDPIGDLAGHFVDERGVFPIWLRRWLIGAIARIMAGEQNRMLVLDGLQGLGKDYFAKWLCSPLPEYFYEGPIMPDDKDHRLRLLSCWIWNVNELGSTTRRSDREALKAFLTIQTIRERKPYGHFDSQGPALSSFIGTVNNEGGILNDPTGHRRFMIAKLKEIDWDYAKIDVDQVWAQAFELYLTGETWRLDGIELEAANEINDEYQTVDIVEETIKELFEVTGDRTDWMSSYEIINILKSDDDFVAGTKGGGLRPGAEIDTRRLASALIKLGLEPTNGQSNSSGKRRRGYFGIKIRKP